MFVYLIQQDSFFPAMRLLLPQLDRDREAYGIKEVGDFANFISNIYSTSHSYLLLCILTINLSVHVYVCMFVYLFPVLLKSCDRLTWPFQIWLDGSTD